MNNLFIFLLDIQIFQIELLLDLLYSFFSLFIFISFKLINRLNNFTILKNPMDIEGVISLMLIVVVNFCYRSFFMLRICYDFGGGEDLTINFYYC